MAPDPDADHVFEFTNSSPNYNDIDFTKTPMPHLKWGNRDWEGAQADEVEVPEVRSSNCKSILLSQAVVTGSVLKSCASACG